MTPDPSTIDTLTTQRDAAIAERDKLKVASTEALGCLTAAIFEGWIDALVEGDIDRIRDLWNRRISFAGPALEAALAQEAPKS